MSGIPDSLELNLRDILTVPEEKTEALVRGVLARAAASEAMAAPRARAMPWRLTMIVGAAAVLLVLVVPTLLDKRDSSAPSIGPSSTEGEKISSAPWIVALERREVEAASSYSEPPGIGAVAEESDLVFVGVVRGLDAGHVQFEVEEVLKGQGLMGGESRLISARPRGWSCSRTLAWEVGERCLLCLQRNPDTGRLNVTRDGSGKVSLPLEPYMSRSDLQALFRKGVFPLDGIVQSMKQEGPVALRRAQWQFGAFPNGGGISQDPRIQEVLRDWLLAQPGKTSDSRDNFYTVVQAARAGTVKDLPTDVEEWVRAEYAEVRESEPNGRFNAFSVLKPFCEAREAWARDRMIEHLDAVVRPGAKKVHWSYRLGGIESLAAVAPEEARQRMWGLYAELPENESRVRRRAIALALQLDPDRGASVCWEYLDQLREKDKWRLPILELILHGGASIRDRLEGLLLDPWFSPSRDSLWQREVRIAGRALNLADLERLLPNWIRDIVQERLEGSKGGRGSFLDWLEMHRYSGGPSSVVIDVLKAALVEEDLSRSEKRKLVAEAREWIDFGALWRELTDAEVDEFIDRLENTEIGHFRIR